MVTATARAINEVWQEHLFQLALTFHGGQQAIGFEWGSVVRENNFVSPDDSSQRALAQTMSQYAGAFQGLSYPYAPMTRTHLSACAAHHCTSGCMRCSTADAG